MQRRSVWTAVAYTTASLANGFVSAAVGLLFVSVSACLGFTVGAVLAVLGGWYVVEPTASFLTAVVDLYRRLRASSSDRRQHG